MTETYPWGYGSTRLTLAEYETRTGWNRLHPEFRRRIAAMMQDAKSRGVDLGLGGGYRSSAQQRTLFLSRYVEDPAGTITWDGKTWSKKPGVASAAPPGRSYHEETDPQGFAFAADLVGDMAWMNANCQRFGLLHFANVNNEPWHVQPEELPRSRSKYTGQQLATYPLNGAPAPTPAPPKPADPPLRFDYPGKPVKLDSRGPAVALVQAVVGASTDGWFGPVTQRLVMRWQRNNGLLADGIVGPITWKAMFG